MFKKIILIALTIACVILFSFDYRININECNENLIYNNLPMISAEIKDEIIKSLPLSSTKELLDINGIGKVKLKQIETDFTVSNAIVLDDLIFNSVIAFYLVSLIYSMKIIFGHYDKCEKYLFKERELNEIVDSLLSIVAKPPENKKK